VLLAALPCAGSGVKQCDHQRLLQAQAPVLCCLLSAAAFDSGLYPGAVSEVRLLLTAVCFCCRSLLWAANCGRRGRVVAQLRRLSANPTQHNLLGHLPQPGQPQHWRRARSCICHCQCTVQIWAVASQWDLSRDCTRCVLQPANGNVMCVVMQVYMLGIAPCCMVILSLSCARCAALPCANPPNRATGVSWACSDATTRSGGYCVGSCVQGAGALLAACINGSYSIAGSCVFGSE
jgi:hypothetical protein